MSVQKKRKVRKIFWGIVMQSKVQLLKVKQATKFFNLKKLFVLLTVKL